MPWAGIRPLHSFSFTSSSSSFTISPFSSPKTKARKTKSLLGDDLTSNILKPKLAFCGECCLVQGYYYGCENVNSSDQASFPSITLCF
ncbi:hypothetical protein LINPERPRIM_LOCUS7581 [Linum perenne]